MTYELSQTKRVGRELTSSHLRLKVRSSPSCVLCLTHSSSEFERSALCWAKRVYFQNFRQMCAIEKESHKKFCKIYLSL